MVAKHLLKKKLFYIGFGGNGNQGRDVIHIEDVCEIIFKQIQNFKNINNELFNIGGGKKNYISLKKLTLICEKLTKNRLKIKKIKTTSNYDIPFFVTDNKKIMKFYNWSPKKNINQIIEDTYNWLKNNKRIINIF